MNISIEPDGINPDGVVLQGSGTSAEVKQDKLVKASAFEFFQPLAIEKPGVTQAIVTTSRSGKPNDHSWCQWKSDRARWLAERAAGREPAYFSMAAFDFDKVSQYKGRGEINVVFITSFWLDVEGSAEKYERHPDGGYSDARAALDALKKFLRATGLKPSFIVFTGSGGFHLHFVLEAPIAKDVWIGRARALVALARTHGFKIDAQCTTDAARIMRAPGSRHQKTGELVEAYRWRVNPYTLEEFDSLTGYSQDTAEPPQLKRPDPGKYDLSVNGDPSVAHPKFSYVQAAKRCGAMHKAALRNGADTLRPVWILAAKTAALSVEGLDFAHEISCGHRDYDRSDTDLMINSLTGGPASCRAWAVAYGKGGPCDTCGHGEH